MKKSLKIPPKYTCEKCDYNTSSKKDYNKHLNTAKHKMETFGNEKIPFLCEICNKQYKTKSGLWKHIKKCKIQNNGVSQEKIHTNVIEIDEYESNDKQVTKDDIISQQQQQIRELKDMMIRVLDDNKENKKLMREMLPKIGNTTSNTTNNYQKISINVFLNEHCKNALNFKDFIETLNVSLEDVLKTKEIGYSKGISNIFIKNLNELETTERPIHCSDKKRLQFYVKDSDEWNKDNGEKIKYAINKCQKKHIERIKDWEEQNKNWKNDERKTNEYFKLIQEIMGQVNETEKDKDIKDIMKNVSDNILLKDALLEI